MALIGRNNWGRRARRPFFVTAAVVTAALTQFAVPAQAAMRGYIVTSFNSIRVEAPVHVMLTTGGGVSARGEGDRALLDRVVLSVSGGLLTVRLAQGPDIAFSDAKGGEPPIISISTGQLKRAQIIGGGTLQISGLGGLEAELSMSGNGEMTVDGADLERLSLYVGGGGRLTVAGKARDVRASVNGPGEIEAVKLDARNATIANDGVGRIHMTVNGPAKVVSTGSGDTVIEGKPICSVNRRGSGAVTCGE